MFRRVSAFFFSLLIINALTFATSANAVPEGLDFASLGPTGQDYHQGTYSLGWRFTANQDIQVTALGFYDDKKNGLIENHDVGIFDLNCNLLARRTVRPTNPLTGFFRYRNIPPVILPAGHDYYIAAVTGKENYAISVTDLIVPPALTFWGYAIYGNTQSTSDLHCPNGSAGQQAFHGDFGPSFKFNDGTLRPSATRVLCNRGPQPGDDFVCTATVGSFDGQVPPPGGVVEFESTEGSFRFGNTCTLLPAPSPSSTSSCGVVYINPTLPVGTVVPVSATYEGSDPYMASTGGTPSTTVARLGKKLRYCLGKADKNGNQSFGKECQGINAIISDEVSGDNLGYLTLGYFSPQGIASRQSGPMSPRSAAAKAPARGISLGLRYLVTIKDNPAFKKLKVAKPFLPKFKNGEFQLGKIGKVNLLFGAEKTVLLKVQSNARKFVKALTGRQLNVRIAVTSFRKGDKSPRSVSGKAKVSVN